MATIRPAVSSHSVQGTDDNDKMSEHIIEAANQPPLKAPMCYSINQIEVIQTLGNHTFASQYEADEILQKIIKLIKPDTTKISRLPTPWREKIKNLRLDNNDFLYMDERLVIPKNLRIIIIRSLHYGHPGKDSMMATVSNVWSPRLHREVVSLTQTCKQCQQAGKNIKPLLRQNQVGKLPKCTEVTQEIAIDFAGPFQNASQAKKYLLVSTDHFSGCPEAKFSPKPTIEKVMEFLKSYIAKHGIPKTIRTDPATIFRSKPFEEFCNKRLIQHIECPVRDHRSNGKIERLIRTINERLRTNNKITVSKDNSGISEILFALRMYPSDNEKSAYEKNTGREPNTIKKLKTEPFRCISEPSTVKLSDTDFESGQDSTILVRERTRGTKLEGAYKKRRGTLLEQTNHTITFLPAGSSESTIISKRDVGKTFEGNNKPCCSREATRLEEIRK